MQSIYFVLLLYIWLVFIWEIIGTANTFAQIKYYNLQFIPSIYIFNVDRVILMVFDKLKANSMQMMIQESLACCLLSVLVEFVGKQNIALARAYCI